MMKFSSQRDEFECQVCCSMFNHTTKYPLILPCPGTKHRICAQCEQCNERRGTAPKSTECPFCRRDYDPDKVVRDDDLIGALTVLRRVRCVSFLELEDVMYECNGCNRKLNDLYKVMVCTECKDGSRSWAEDANFESMVPFYSQMGVEGHVMCTTCAVEHAINKHEMIDDKISFNYSLMHIMPPRFVPISTLTSLSMHLLTDRRFPYGMELWLQLNMMQIKCAFLDPDRIKAVFDSAVDTIRRSRVLSPGILREPALASLTPAQKAVTFTFAVKLIEWMHDAWEVSEDVREPKALTLLLKVCGFATGLVVDMVDVSPDVKHGRRLLRLALRYSKKLVRACHDHMLRLKKEPNEERKELIEQLVEVLDPFFTYGKLEKKGKGRKGKPIRSLFMRMFMEETTYAYSWNRDFGRLLEWDDMDKYDDEYMETGVDISDWPEEPRLKYAQDMHEFFMPIVYNDRSECMLDWW